MAEAATPLAMTLHSHWGHADIRRALARARARESLPSALLIHGDRGVGKQHLALWIGRLLLCDRPSDTGPCDECKPCRSGLRIEHPDLHWFFPLPRPKGASSPQKLARGLEEARADALIRFREGPLRTTHVDEPRSLYLAAAQTLRRQAQKRPSQGNRQVFIIADAEALAPGDASSEAANALLKLLEEPPPGTYLILTSAEPGRLLPTIRSRTTPLHLPPLSAREVAEFLREVAGVEPDAAETASMLAQGSIGRALGFLPDGDDPGPLEAARSDAYRLLSAAVSKSPHSLFETASRFGPAGARGMFRLMDSLQDWLRDLALVAAGTLERLRNREKLEILQTLVTEEEIHPASVARAARRIDAARKLATGNVNPQLIVFGLLREIREDLLVRETPVSWHEGP